jgi:hemoglobin/transferrin/lactoferrin receptor protein
MFDRSWWTPQLLYAAALFQSTTAIAGEGKSSNDDTNDAVKIDKIVVEERLNDSKMILLDADSIQEQVIFGSKDLFRSTPDVSIGGGSRNAQRIYLNGIEGSNLNISVDGARSGSNLHQHRGGYGGVDPDLLKQVEIGSTSGVTDGPGALGGSIRMTTVDAQDMLQRYGSDKVFGARIKAGYSSIDEGKHGDATFYGMATEHLGILAHIAADNREDYETGGDRTVTGSGGEDRDYLLKFSLLNFNDQNLKLGISRTGNEGLYARGSNGSDAGYLPEEATGPSVPVRQETEEERLTLTHNWNPNNALLDLQTNMYRTENTLSYPGSTTEDIRTQENGLAVRNNSYFELAGRPSQLIVGADWFKETAYTNALDMQDSVAWPDLAGQDVEYTNKNLGVFVESSVETGALTTTLGVRLDDFNSDYGPVQVDGDEVSPALQLDYTLNQDVAFFGSYSEAARATGIIPVGFLGRLNQTTSAEGGDLEVETSRQQEIGFRYTPAHWPLSLQLKAFHTRIDDTIQTVGQGSVPLGAGDIFNGEALDVRGWQLNTDWHSSSYSTQLGLNIIDVEYGDEDPGAVRRLTAPTGDTLVWDNRWQASDTLTLGYTLELVADLEDVPSGEPDRDGYHVHSIRAQWQPLNNIEVGLAINNLFDRRYANHTSLYSSSTGIVEEPGRDIRLNLAYTL